MSASKRRRLAEAEGLFGDAMRLHHRGLLEDAARAYDAVLHRIPKHSGALNMRGVLALQRGDPAAALADFDRATAVDSGRAGLHLNRGNALRALGRREEALTSYERAIAIDPQLAIAHVNRANILRDDGSLDAAMASYRCALEVDPDCFAAAANLAFASAEQSADDAMQLEACLLALEVADRQGIRGREVARLHDGAGVLHRRRDRLDLAVSSFRHACEHDPDSAAAHARLGNALSDVGQYEEALPSLRRASELEPDAPEHLEGLALLLRRLGRNDDAAEVYRRWSEHDPGNPIPAHMLVSLSGGRPPEAAGEAYVRREFDGFAAKFDSILVEKLDYRAPELIHEALMLVLDEDASGLDVLDLGCGTGLCAPRLRPRAKRLVGVDLSPGMLERAVERGYDELVESDITVYCHAHPEAFDLLVAADVLVYIGALPPVFSAARASLRRGGHFAFTLERSDDEDLDYRLNAGGRYTHAEAYARRALANTGFALRSIAGATLRTELRVDVRGLVVVARAT